MLSAGNWGGVGLHLRGNVEGFLGVGSEHRFLEIHSDNHVVPFYSLEGRLTQKRFLDQWLSDVDTGILREPRVKLAVRYGGERYRWRYEHDWPLPGTEWRELHLDAERAALAEEAPETPSATVFGASVDADDADARTRFALPEFEAPTEVIGPAKLAVAVSTTEDDADLFVVLRKLDANGEEVRFPGQSSPSIPAACGWLRLSHRKLDRTRATFYRPYHAHDEIWKVRPGEAVHVEIEIWPTSVAFEPGERLVLEIASRDDPGMEPFLHTHPDDRIQRGTVTIHTGGEHPSHLLLPVVPAA